MKCPREKYGHRLTMRKTASHRRRNSTSGRWSKVRNVGPFWSFASAPTLLCPNPDSEASIGMQQPPSRPFIYTLASPAEHQWLGTYVCDLPMWVICAPSLENRGLLCSIFLLSWSVSLSMKADPSETAASQVFCSTLCWASRTNPTTDQSFISNHSAWLLTDRAACAVYLSQQVCLN